MSSASSKSTSISSEHSTSPDSIRNQNRRLSTTGQNFSLTTATTTIPKIIHKRVRDFIGINNLNPEIQSKFVNQITSKLKPDFHPSSWKDLNQQMFCPLKYTSENSMKLSNNSNLNKKNAWRKSIGQQLLLEFIYENQFLANPSINCDLLLGDRQFVILDMYQRINHGLGSTLYGYFSRFLSRSLVLNRTLLLTGIFDWAQVHYCAPTHGYECYFLPISNCIASRNLEQDYQIIYANIKSESDAESGSDTILKLGYPKEDECFFGNEDKESNTKIECKWRVIYINSNSRGMEWHPSRRMVVFLAVFVFCLFCTLPNVFFCFSGNSFGENILL
jgi:hypothetical protein